MYKNPLSVTSQFSFCGLPFRLDTYTGCAFSCTYCFARLRGGNINTKKIKSADSDYIIKRFKNANKNIINKPGIISEYIKREMPVHFGGMSDPFQNIELKLRTTLRVLKFLCSIQYPIVISTKSDLISQEPYLSVLKSNKKIIVQFSLSTTSDNIAKIVEPAAIAPSKLFKTIEKLSQQDIITTLRWQPYIPRVSEIPELFIRNVANLGIKHVGFEHLKLPTEKNNPLQTQVKAYLDIDIRSHYKSASAIQDGREYILPSINKLNIINKVRDETHKYGLTFGAADNEFQYLSDTNCCCSGVDQFKGFENWNKFQIAYAVKKSNGKPITFDLIKNEWAPKGSLDMYLNSKTRIQKENSHNTVYDYIVNRWQNIHPRFSPQNFYGVSESGLEDEKGFKIYKWE